MSEQPIRIVIPTGRMYDDVRQLLEDAGLRIPKASKNYRPVADDPRFRIKLLKAANIPTLLELGAHDLGFSGTDWVRETGAGVDTLLDTGLLPVRIVSAAPAGMNPFGKSPGRPIVVASEYERITTDYMASRKVDFRFVRTYGATEVFPPEDADLIVDNTATGSALAANRLEIVDELLCSTTCFLANPSAMRQPGIRQAAEDLTLLMRSVLEARRRVLLEMNVDTACLEQVVAMLPAMKSPTVQPLSGNSAVSVKVAVLREAVPALIPRLKRAGATDILETRIRRVTP
jgi:ATP phosphoribosyltransferase